ncbi:MAG: hypothetical protein NXI10_10440 [bacterium]|nr:hypothetical protein [bacterium]
MKIILKDTIRKALVPIFVIGCCLYAEGQTDRDSLTMTGVKSKLEGDWKNDRRFRGKSWITTFRFITDSTGSWTNNRTISTAPAFVLRESNGVFYLRAIDFLGGECAPRKIVVLTRKKLVLQDPESNEKFRYKRQK